MPETSNSERTSRGRSKAKMKCVASWRMSDVPNLGKEETDNSTIEPAVWTDVMFSKRIVHGVDSAAEETTAAARSNERTPRTGSNENKISYHH